MPKPPLSSFTSAPTPQQLIPLTFDASSSLPTNPGATIQAYTWNWRDASPSPLATTNPIIQHTFQFAGDYTVTLGVNDTYGVSGYGTTVVSVIPRSDFAISIPVFPTLGLGDTATVPLALTSVRGFTGIVILSASFGQPPSARLPTVSFAQNSLKLTSGGTNETFVTVSTMAATSPISFVVTFVGTSGSLSRTVEVTFSVVDAQPPLFAHFHWKHHVSIVESGNDQTFVADVLNPSNQTSIYVVVRVQGVGSDGLATFAANSITSQILPGQTVADIPINGAFDTQDMGLTFSFSAQISLGLGTTSMSGTSRLAESGVHTSGSLRILP